MFYLVDVTLCGLTLNCLTFQRLKASSGNPTKIQEKHEFTDLIGISTLKYFLNFCKILKFSLLSQFLFVLCLLAISFMVNDFLHFCKGNKIQDVLNQFLFWQIHLGRM